MINGISANPSGTRIAKAVPTILIKGEYFGCLAPRV
jgi:hypothetical protein